MASDVFSLGCILSEILTLALGIDCADYLASRRSRRSEADFSFHGNLGRVAEWLSKLKDVCAGSDMEADHKLDLAQLLRIIEAMLVEDPARRIRSRRLAIAFGRWDAGRA